MSGRRSKRIRRTVTVSIQRLGGEYPDHASVLQLTGVYHNLLRRWADL